VNRTFVSAFVSASFRCSRDSVLCHSAEKVLFQPGSEWENGAPKRCDNASIEFDNQNAIQAKRSNDVDPASRI
jgi:hypothetical protein